MRSVRPDFPGGVRVGFDEFLFLSRAISGMVFEKVEPGESTGRTRPDVRFPRVDVNVANAIFSVIRRDIDGWLSARRPGAESTPEDFVS